MCNKYQILFVFSDVLTLITKISLQYYINLLFIICILHTVY